MTEPTIEDLELSHLQDPQYAILSVLQHYALRQRWRIASDVDRLGFQIRDLASGACSEGSRAGTINQLEISLASSVKYQAYWDAAWGTIDRELTRLRTKAAP